MLNKMKRTKQLLSLILLPLTLSQVVSGQNTGQSGNKTAAIIGDTSAMDVKRDTSGVIMIKLQVKENNQEPVMKADEMPKFPGGDVGLLKYISKNTEYPESAWRKGLHGKVLVRFCVTAEGKVSLISVLRGVCPELDKEAVRVVSMLPPFIPGKIAGKPVPVWYLIPIDFNLK
jgi:TonB family protein